MTRQDASRLIRRFLAGGTRDYEWDDFVTLQHKGGDVMDGIRKYLCEIHVSFPASEAGKYCNEQGLAELARVADLLAGNMPLEIDAEGAPRAVAGKS